MSNLMQTSTQETWLWVGTIGMALGAFAIIALGARVEKHRYLTMVGFFTCAVSALAYLLMAFGQGDIVISKATLAITPIGVGADVTAELIYWARYLDLLITTPIMLLGLVFVAVKAAGTGEEFRQHFGLAGGLLGAAILMIFTGIFGALSLEDNHMWVWFAVSVGFLIAVFLIIWGRLRAAAADQGGAIATLYGRLLGIFTAFWVLNIVIWVLGDEGTGTLSLNTEVIVFTIVDIAAMVGFGVLLVLGARELESGGSASAKPAASS